ncbi:hypothetical protein CW751_09780 [Brumimicrobium salinarum]|uniref:Uncharacterized protein n=1 Tax=Brumimicrobium salinarum TaxID=2058658 RepID=A0A2I0R1A6_9FLAO|nr:hypothetical protein [Brumimicrobium salinarum]PKR80356.1 hypothetical protein CW751_09780 [Brumimicrobium salinarum]
MKKIILLLLLSLIYNISFSQVKDSRKRKDILKEYGLKRNNQTLFILGGFHITKNTNIVISPSSDNYTQTEIDFYDRHFGVSFRFSSNWYFTPRSKNRWYFRTNWIMGGLVWADGLLFPSAPLNIGFGDNIKLSKDVNLDLTLSGGLALIGPGFMSDYINYIGVIYPEIKLQTKWFSVGLIYARYPEQYKTGKSIYHTLLIGLSSGI